MNTVRLVLGVDFQTLVNDERSNDVYLLIFNHLLDRETYLSTFVSYICSWCMGIQY